MVTKPKFVMVVTYGRSGSTLLMAMLNTVRGARVTGENFGALYFIYKAIEAVRQSKVQFGKAEMATDYAWYGAHDINPAAFSDDLMASFRKNVLGTTGFETLIGFKEIRYSENRMSDKDFNGFLLFVLDAIPNSLIIINTRNLAATAQSGWFKGKPNAEANLRRFEARLLAFAAQNDDRVVVLHYDTYVTDPGVVVAALKRFGIAMDTQKLEQVLARKHSTSAIEQQRDGRRRKPSRTRRVFRTLYSRFL
jgi:Sulfotransferase family